MQERRKVVKSEKARRSEAKGPKLEVLRAEAGEKCKGRGVRTPET